MSVSISEQSHPDEFIMVATCPTIPRETWPPPSKSARATGGQMGEQCLWPPRERTDREMELGILAPPHPQKPLKGFWNVQLSGLFPREHVQWEQDQAVCLFPGAVITKDHRLGAETTETHCFLLLEAGSLRLRCQQGWFVLRVPSEGSLLISGRLPAIFGGPWFLLYHPSLEMPSSGILCVPTSTSKVPLSIKMPVILNEGPTSCNMISF